MKSTRAPHTWRDNAERFGLVSLALHWLIALLLFWQFGCVLVKIAGGPFSWNLQKEMGFALLMLALLRGIWGIINLKNRPSYEHLATHKAAIGGQVVMYLLMIIVPAIAMLRQAGSGRAFSFLGIEITANTGVTTPWMMAPANFQIAGLSLHDWLGWLLLVLIVGHIVIAFIHHFVWKDGLLNRIR